MIIDCDKDVLLIKSEARRRHKLSYGKGKLFLFRVDMESNKIEECEKVLKNPDEIYKDEK